MPIEILWSPRDVLAGRLFRLPIRSSRPVTLENGAFRILQTTTRPDGVTCFYVAAPAQPGCCRVTAVAGAERASADITVRVLDGLREVRRVGRNVFPRRWPLGSAFTRTKRGQTFVTAPDFITPALAPDARAQARWILSIPAAEAWAQLPPAELPRTGVVNKKEGCPTHGTAVFAHGGFYPWRTEHDPARAACRCPVGGETYPSNRILEGDFTSGPYADDGFGWLDTAGHRFQFAAYYNWFQMSRFLYHIGRLASLLTGGTEPEGERAPIARRLGLLLVRQAVEELYLAAVPQFRYGSHNTALDQSLWGPPDTALCPTFPGGNGTVHYCVSMPGVAAQLATAYDAAYPWLAHDAGLVAELQALGVPVQSPDDVLQVVEEMLASFLQHHIDGYSGCNHPGTSVGSLVCLRVLDRPDMREFLDFLYDDCDDQIRTCVTNGFYPDGVCYEASGGYSAGHVYGTFELDRHIEGLRRMHPDIVRPDRYPAITADPRFPLITLPYATTTLCDRAVAAYGDDRAPGSVAEGGSRKPALPAPCLAWTGWVPAPVFYREVFRCLPTLLNARILRRLGVADQEPEAMRLLAAENPEWPQEGLLLDHGGIGILRVPGPGRERAAAFLHFISQPFHRHDDFHDLQLVAFDRTWYQDFGYPAIHETCEYWEGHWVTHNRGKILDGAEDQDVVGTGVCSLFVEGALASAIETEGSEGSFHDWRLWTPQPKHHRRLVVLLPTVGDGVALVDCYRLFGGAEHWRTFPGLQGSLQWGGSSPLAERPGTAAGVDIERGQREKARPGCAGLALIDAVREGTADAPWNATWSSRDDARWRLDVHGVQCPPGTTAITGRAGHPLTRPDESPYSYTPLLLRAPAGPRTASAFDLVFEPYGEAPTLQSVERLTPATGTPADAVGIRLRLVDGTTRIVLWNPDRRAPAAWEGGWQLDGSLAVWKLDAAGRPAECLLPAGARAEIGSAGCAAPVPATGRVVECPDDCTVVVDPDPGSAFKAGDRIRMLARGHWYRIVAIASASGQKVRLTLDRPRVLSRVRVAGAQGCELVLESRLPLAWAGYFRHCMLEDRTGRRVPIEDVRMREDRMYAFGILASQDPTLRTVFAPGSWADLVDYTAGDRVQAGGQAETVMR